MIEIYDVLLSDEALNDLEEIYSYIAFSLQATAAAEKQVNRIIFAVAQWLKLYLTTSRAKPA